MAGERTLPGLGLTGFWTYGSDNWKDQNDANLRMLSAVAQLAVISQVAAEPGSPADGDMHLLTGTANINKIAVRDNGAWVYLTPIEGWLCWDKATDVFLFWTSSAWVQYLSAARVKTAYELNANTNAYTDAEKAKLAGLVSSYFRGTYVDSAALIAAHPAPVSGSYAFVDAGAASSPGLYIWDSSDTAWTLATSGGGGGGVAVQDEGSGVLAPAVALNFTGAGVSVADGGGGVATVTIAGAAVSAINAVAASRSLALTDTEDILEVTTASAIVLTIPTNVTAAFPIGTVIGVTLLNASAALNITAAGGVVLNGITAGTGAVTPIAFSGVTLYKRATDAWVVQGQIGTVA